MIFIDYLKKHFSFSAEEMEMLEMAFEKTTFKKGEYFLKEGQYARRIGFVESGAMLYFQNNEAGDEKVCDFGFPGDWVTHIKSMISGTPTDMNIRALETTTIRWITGETMQKLSEKIPASNLMRVQISEQYFVKSADRAASLANLNAEQRYRKVVEETPELLMVPQYYLASYLGIKPQSLSRIRAKK